jgi:DNA topoisomerase-3
MRAQGLGTPATRAAILATLLRRNYISRRKRDLLATDTGKALVDAVTVPELRSAELTGRWEGRLSAIGDSKAPRSAFMQDVATHVHALVEAIGRSKPNVTVQPIEGADLGQCPVCEQPVRDAGRVYRCIGSDCSFIIYKTMSKRAISTRTVKQLLTKGRSDALKGFRSKAGKEFRAGLIYDADRGRVGFWFEDEKPSRGEPKNLAPKEGHSCPGCGTGRVIRGRVRLGCSRWRDGCGWTH